jgi:hypothetical protein
MPIDVPREPTSDETPSASAKLGTVTSASQPAECTSRLPLGASEGATDEREQKREARGHARGEEGEAGTSRHDELAEYAGAEVAGPERCPDEDCRHGAQLREYLHRPAEVLQAPWRAVLGRVGRVQDGQDDVRDDHRGHREDERRDDEAATLAQLQKLGAREPQERPAPRAGPRRLCGESCRVHAASSNRDVISRNRRSSDMRAGSKRRIARPARTMRRPMSSASASASASI